MEPDPAKAREVAVAYGEEEECDVLLLTGSLDLDAYWRVYNSDLGRDRRKRILVVLVTWGGDAHGAFKMGRCFHRRYESVRMFLPGPCKSAGTLLAIGGHELVVGDHGELGPIDVQQMRQDDLWERASGLIESSALESLGQVAWDMFEKLVTETKDMSLGRITFKTAAEAASPIVSGVLSPIFAQIDPIKVGETARALQIASQYAELLGRSSRNLRDGYRGIDKLARGYPDHGFVIDREEAKALFNNVTEPDDRLLSLAKYLGPLDPGRDATIYLNKLTSSETDEVSELATPAAHLTVQNAPTEETQNGVQNETTATKEDPPVAAGQDVADDKQDQTADGSGAK